MEVVLIAGMLVSRQVWCGGCRSFQPLLEEEPHEDDLNEFPWYDLVCDTCKLVLLSIRIVPEEVT